MAYYNESTFERLPDTVPLELRQRVSCLRNAVKIVRRAIPIPATPKAAEPVDLPKSPTVSYNAAPYVGLTHDEPAPSLNVAPSVPLASVEGDVLASHPSIGEVRAAIDQAYYEEDLGRAA